MTMLDGRFIKDNDFYLLSDGNRVDMGLIQAIAKLIDSCSDLLLGGVNIRALAVRWLFFS